MGRGGERKEVESIVVGRGGMERGKRLSPLLWVGQQLESEVHS